MPQGAPAADPVTMETGWHRHPEVKPTNWKPKRNTPAEAALAASSDNSEKSCNGDGDDVGADAGLQPRTPILDAGLVRDRRPHTRAWSVANQRP